MTATALSGTAGALYYKPAGTIGTFGEAGVNAGTDVITVEPYLNFKAGDPVKFRIYNPNTGDTVTPSGSNAAPAGVTIGTTYYVLSYTASSGALTVSTASGGTILPITDDGTLAAPNEFMVYYADYTAVGQVRDWSFEISRSEIDVTTIGQAAGQYAPFRNYIAGFADGNGSATVYMTDEDAAMSNRMIEDVLQRQQVGAAFKLYIDRVISSGTVSDTLSRSISMDAILTSANMTINPDDAQSVSINFRPSGTVSFDLATT
jgi:hypothetical protein